MRNNDKNIGINSPSYINNNSNIKPNISNSNININN